MCVSKSEYYIDSKKIDEPFFWKLASSHPFIMSKPAKKLKILTEDDDVPVSQEKKPKKPKQQKKEKQVPESCPVCLDDYTAVVRKKVVCKYCKKGACAKCIERYLLERIEDAHCLHCRVNYDDTCLQEICTKTYLQDKYAKHRQEVLVSRERANLPGLQEQAVAERRKRDRQARMQEMVAELDQLKVGRDTLLIEYNQAYADYHAARHTRPAEEVDRLFEIYRAKQKESDAYRRNVNEKEEKYYQLLREFRRGQIQGLEGDDEEQKEGEGGSAAAGSAAGSSEKKKFIRRCTRDGCQGFLSTAWKCALCEYYSCNKCFTPRGQKPDDPHECRKEDVETADLIRKDSKPCPNCGVFIIKTEGCNMMFCVSCQTPFDWGTGKIVTSGAIHNPHYYEWLRRNGHHNTRNPADVPCGGYPAGWELNRLPHDFDKELQRLYPGKFPPHLDRKFYEFHRLCMEIQDVSTRQWQTHLTQDASHRINIQFLLGDYDEKRWGQLLAQLERKRKRDREVQEVFAAFRMVAVELLNRFQNFRHKDRHTITKPPIFDIAGLLYHIQIEYTALLEMINDAFRQISIRHRYAVPFITLVNSYGNHIRYILTGRRYGEKEEAVAAASAKVEGKAVEVVVEKVAEEAAAAAVASTATTLSSSERTPEDREAEAEAEAEAEDRVHAERFFQELQQALMASLTEQ